MIEELKIINNGISNIKYLIRLERNVNKQRVLIMQLYLLLQDRYVLTKGDKL
jgi:hypothetical protein